MKTVASNKEREFWDNCLTVNVFVNTTLVFPLTALVPWFSSSFPSYTHRLGLVLYQDAGGGKSRPSGGSADPVGSAH